MNCCIDSPAFEVRKAKVRNVCGDSDGSRIPTWFLVVNAILIAPFAHSENTTGVET